MFEDIAELLGLNPKFEKGYFLHNTHYRTKYGTHSDYSRLKFFDSSSLFFEILPNVPELIPGKRNTLWSDFLTLDQPATIIHMEVEEELDKYPTIDDLM